MTDPNGAYRQQLAAVVVQLGDHLVHVLPRPLGEGGLVVGHGGDARPHRLVRRSERPEDPEQLVDLRVPGEQGPLGDLGERGGEGGEGGKGGESVAVR